MAKDRPSDFDFQRALQRISGTEEEARVAFKELHNYFGGIIYLVGMRFLKSKELSDDLVQEVFTKVWVKRQELNHVRDFEGYLIGITKHKALDILRTATAAELARMNHMQIMKVQDDPIQEELAVRLDKLVDQLPPRRREVFKLAKIQGLKAKEIAVRLKITVLNVHKHVYKATRFINERKHDVISILLVTATVYSCLYRFL